jgi:hypothetical protein
VTGILRATGWATARRSPPIGPRSSRDSERERPPDLDGRRHRDRPRQGCRRQPLLSSAAVFEAQRIHRAPRDEPPTKPDRLRGSASPRERLRASRGVSLRIERTGVPCSARSKPAARQHPDRVGGSGASREPAIVARRAAIATDAGEDALEESTFACSSPSRRGAVGLRPLGDRVATRPKPRARVASEVARVNDPSADHERDRANGSSSPTEATT